MRGFADAGGDADAGGLMFCNALRARGGNSYGSGR